MESDSVETPSRNVDPELIISRIKQVVADNSGKSGTVPSEENIRMLKVQQLLAEADALKTSEIKGMVEDPVERRSMLLQTLKSDMVKLEELVLAARAKRTRLTQDLESQNEMKAELSAIQEKLNKELTEINNKTSSATVQQKRQEEELQRKLTAHEKLLKTRMSQMSEFLKEHYPPPEQTRQNQNSRKSRGRQGFDENTATYLSMLSILERLMNKCMQSPEEPYIDVDEEFWPPYIEMLLRYGVIQKHPNITDRIKLTPYHL